MIVLHDHKLIFLKPRKVAGTSFEIALSKFSANPNDILTPISEEDENLRKELGFTGAQNSDQSFKQRLQQAARTGNLRQLFGEASAYWNHMPAVQVRDLLGKDVFETYTKVSLYRSPIDRIVSSFFWRKSRNKHDVDFETFCFEHAKWTENYPQYFINDTFIVDHLIRFTDLKGDIHRLEDRIPSLKGLYDTFAQIKTKGKSRPKNAKPAEMLAQYPSVQPLADGYDSYETKKILDEANK